MKNSAFSILTLSIVGLLALPALGTEPPEKKGNKCVKVVKLGGNPKRTIVNVTLSPRGKEIQRFLITRSFFRMDENLTHRPSYRTRVLNRVALLAELLESQPQHLEVFKWIARSMEQIERSVTSSEAMSHVQKSGDRVLLRFEETIEKLVSLLLDAPVAGIGQSGVKNTSDGRINKIEDLKRDIKLLTTWLDLRTALRWLEIPQAEHLSLAQYFTARWKKLEDLEALPLSQLSAKLDHHSLFSDSVVTSARGSLPEKGSYSKMRDEDAQRIITMSLWNVHRDLGDAYSAGPGMHPLLPM